MGDFVPVISDPAQHYLAASGKNMNSAPSYGQTLGKDMSMKMQITGRKTLVRMGQWDYACFASNKERRQVSLGEELRYGREHETRKLRCKNQMDLANHQDSLVTINEQTLVGSNFEWRQIPCSETLAGTPAERQSADVVTSAVLHHFSNRFRTPGDETANQMQLLKAIVDAQSSVTSISNILQKNTQGIFCQNFPVNCFVQESDL